MKEETLSKRLQWESLPWSSCDSFMKIKGAFNSLRPIGVLIEQNLAMEIHVINTEKNVRINLPT